MELRNKAGIPEEILHQVIRHLGGCLPTLIALSAVSKQFCLLSRPFTFSHVTIEDKDRLSGFLALYSEPRCWLPSPVGRSRLIVKDPSILDAIPPSELAVMRANIQARDSLVIELPHAQISPTLIQSIGLWSNNVFRLTLSGGFQAPDALFPLLSSFPRLKSLTLVELSLEDDGVHPPSQFCLPQAVEQLAFIRCPRLMAFFDTHVPGWSASIRNLYIQAVFSKDQEGVERMMEIIWESLQGVERLTLDALYDVHDDHIDLDMADIFCPERFMRIPGLKRLDLNLARVPSKVTESILRCLSLPNPKHNIETINVYVPTSPDLWPGATHYELFSSICETIGLRDPSKTLKRNRAKLVLHGFFYPLPPRIQAGCDSMVWGLNKFPWAFGRGDGEQMMKEMLGVVQERC